LGAYEAILPLGSLPLPRRTFQVWYALEMESSKRIRKFAIMLGTIRAEMFSSHFFLCQSWLFFGGFVLFYLSPEQCKTQKTKNKTRQKNQKYTTFYFYLIPVLVVFAFSVTY
jgi:hypothetical protein